METPTLPQGSVLALVLFNLYSNDLPVTRGRKFIYADDICLAIQSQYLANWNAVSRQIWHGCHTISSVFHLYNISATRKLSVYLDGQRIRHECHPTNLGVTRPYAVPQRTLDKHCTQAEEPKQLVDQASQLHLGRQCQQSAVICSGTLLSSSRVLRPSLVTLCSHKSGRCVVELYHACHLWYPPFYTSPMASSTLQH